MSKLNDAMNYKPETLYTSVNIMDRYLINISSQGQNAQCLVNLGVTCLMIAAKLGSGKKISFSKMIRTLNRQFNITVAKSNFIKLESDILKTLEFDV